MADVITRFKLETTQYDSKLRDASKGLAEYTRKATLAGNEFGKFTQKNIEAARALGTITPSATNAKDKVKELVGAFNDAAKAYNALTKEQQQSDFGKAMAESISQLNVKIKEAKQELYGMDDAMKKAGSGGGLFAGLGDKMSGALQVFAGNMLTKAAGAVANLGSEIFSSVQQGIELARQGEGIRIAFERLGRGDILDGLRQATHGTVTDLELMKAAVKFNDFKLPVEELGTMLAFAQQKAKDTGQSVDFLVESIVNGLGRKSLMILDNLGLSATEVKERMAETGDMTKAVGDIIREQMVKAGDYVETAADRAAQANVSLQNKMEELGRKFAPVEEASSQLWTSMKIGILDIIGGPLATLLNQLTEAGRLKNMLNNMNGEPGSGNTKVDQQIKKLNVIKKAGGSDYIFNSTLNGMLEDYNRQIAALDAKIKDTKKLSPDQQASKFVRDEVQKMSEQMKALGMMRDQLAAGAKELSKPVDVKIETKGAEQNVESLKLKLIELEAQRKKAIAAGDTDLSKNLAKQITQVKSDIKGLNPTSLSTTHTLTKPEKADEAYKKAQHDYEQALAQAALEVKAGTINSADAKKKELQAAESLWKSIGDARDTYDSPKLKEAQAKVEQDIIRLGGEVTKAVEVQKRSGAGGGGTTEPTYAADSIAAQQKLVSELTRQWTEAGASVRNDYIQPLIEAETKLKEMKDEQALLKEQAQGKLKGGEVETPVVADVSSSIYTSIDEIRNELAENPIVIPIESTEKDVKAIAKAASITADVVGSIGDAFNAIEDPAGKVMGTVMQSIASVALGYAQATVAAAQTGNPWVWAAFAISGLATMMTMISSIHSATGYAQGGIVEGNSYSGDNMMFGGDGLYGLNAGELVLTKSQQNSLAQQLSGNGMGNINVSGRISGTDILLSADRAAQASGRGQLVTWK